MYFLSWGICRARMRWAREHTPPGRTPERGQPNHLVKTSSRHQAWTSADAGNSANASDERARPRIARTLADRANLSCRNCGPMSVPEIFGRGAHTARHSADASNMLRASSQFARVAKGVDLRSTGGNSAWVRTPQLTSCQAWETITRERNAKRERFARSSAPPRIPLCPC